MKIYSMILVGLFCVACSSSGDGSKDKGSGTPGGSSGQGVLPTNEILNGKWVDACAASGPRVASLSRWGSDAVPVDRAASSSSMGLLEFSGDNAIVTYTVFTSSSDCSGQPEMEVTIDQSYALTGVSSVGPDISNIDLVLKSMTMKLFTQVTADAYNTIAYCGFNDWSPGVAKDITGKQCGSHKQDDVNSRLYSLVQVRDNLLDVGEADSTHDGKTPETRPVQLSGAPLARQP